MDSWNIYKDVFVEMDFTCKYLYLWTFKKSEGYTKVETEDILVI